MKLLKLLGGDGDSKILLMLSAKWLKALIVTIESSKNQGNIIHKLEKSNIAEQGH